MRKTGLTVGVRRVCLCAASCLAVRQEAHACAGGQLPAVLACGAHRQMPIHHRYYPFCCCTSPCLSCVTRTCVYTSSAYSLTGTRSHSDRSTLARRAQLIRPSMFDHVVTAVQPVRLRHESLQLARSSTTCRGKPNNFSLAPHPCHCGRTVSMSSAPRPWWQLRLRQLCQVGAGGAAALVSLTCLSSLRALP